MEDKYPCLDADCYFALKSAITDPDNPLFLDLEDDCVDKDQFIAALNKMVYSSEENLYYLLDHTDSTLEDAIMSLEIFGDENGVDCGLDYRVYLNSHQGVGGM